ncbi:hypothetical protein [Bacillus sp. 165]|uniref:hypothetical protein n=1 Tax=Bacillus sp. 165 TaxID=1529117 RepID=UPI001ADC09F0|nr:hypothetical protein [Bacillus sp. 165]MBO9129135.1 hypothetical protein [Bacillus sp. 165]
MFKKKIICHDDSEEYKDIIIESQEKHPNDYLKQLEYVRDNGTKQHYSMWLADRLQYVSTMNRWEKLELKGAHTDLIGRSLLNALSHMQTDLPDGVYDYIIEKMETTILDVIKHLTKQP